MYIELLPLFEVDLTGFQDFAGFTGLRDGWAARIDSWPVFVRCENKWKVFDARGWI